MPQAVGVAPRNNTSGRRVAAVQVVLEDRGPGVLGLAEHLGHETSLRIVRRRALRRRLLLLRGRAFGHLQHDVGIHAEIHGHQRQHDGADADGAAAADARAARAAVFHIVAFARIVQTHFLLRAGHRPAILITALACAAFRSVRINPWLCFYPFIPRIPNRACSSRRPNGWAKGPGGGAHRFQLRGGGAARRQERRRPPAPAARPRRSPSPDRAVPRPGRDRPFRPVDNRQYRLLKAATPGPWTFILEATKEVPRRVSHPSRKTIGIRVPDHVVMLGLLEQTDGPLLSTTLIPRTSPTRSTTPRTSARATTMNSRPFSTRAPARNRPPLSLT